MSRQESPIVRDGESGRERDGLLFDYTASPDKFWLWVWTQIRSVEPYSNVIDMAICTDICTVRSFVQYSNLYGMVDCTVPWFVQPIYCILENSQ